MHLPLLQRNISGGHGAFEAAIELPSPSRTPAKRKRVEHLDNGVFRLCVYAQFGAQLKLSHRQQQLQLQQGNRCSQICHRDLSGSIPRLLNAGCFWQVDAAIN